MQNRYAGDIGDYSKFILIKRLFKNQSIGLVWFLYPNETHNSDGLHINYQNYKLSDKELTSILQNIGISKQRSVYKMQKKLTKYFNDQKIKYFDEFIENNFHYTQREKLRKRWIEKAIKCIKNCNVVFLDPDNGIEVKSIKKTNKKSGKYVFFDEIEKFLKACEILVIYQHFPRIKHDIFIKNMFKTIRQKINGNYQIYALKFKPVSPRVYFILVKKEARNIFENNLKTFLNSHFSSEFELKAEDEYQK